MSHEFQVSGTNADALFTLRAHRGDGMALLAMNWKEDQPPTDFVGFAIEYKEPRGDKFYALKNRLAFPQSDKLNPNRMSSIVSPFQKFRWVHCPRNADLTGEFVYRVTPVFMNSGGELSYGEPQVVAIELQRETYPGKLNVTFTRGFVSSQAFVEKYVTKTDGIETLLPKKADAGLKFKPTHPQAVEALAWMGFEARSAIVAVLDEALKDAEAQVCVVAYDLNEPEIVDRLKQLGQRLRIIIDNSGTHGKKASAETAAEGVLRVSAGDQQVKRQHMGGLQHNKTIAVDGPSVQAVVCGSTNLSWRGLFVQANNAVILHGKGAVKAFNEAFNRYWQSDKVSDFGGSPAAGWNNLGLAGIKAQVSFSPHTAANALLASVASDIGNRTESSLFYSLAFLYETPGPVLDAIRQVSSKADVFVYGISDRQVGGLDLQDPDGNVNPVYPAALEKNLPQPFKREVTGGAGARMHHKFAVIDFDKPTARVYLGSYNFSAAADGSNGENLLLIQDRRIAVSYMVEALRIFDHYEFRVLQEKSKVRKKELMLALPPRKAGDQPWWQEYYTVPQKIRDRKLFASE